MTQEVTCPACGNVFEAKRQNAKGEGAHYGPEMKLSGQHKLILLVLRDHNCTDPRSGLRVQGVTKYVNLLVPWAKERDMLPDTTIRYDPHGLGGRLSELQGKALVTTAANVVEQKGEEDEHQFRTWGKGELWYLTELGVQEAAELDAQRHLVPNAAPDSNTMAGFFG